MRGIQKRAYSMYYTHHTNETTLNVIGLHKDVEKMYKTKKEGTIKRGKIRQDFNEAEKVANSGKLRFQHDCATYYIWRLV